MNNNQPLNVETIFENFFIAYCEECEKDGLSFRVTSRTRAGNIRSNPHALEGNAIDIVLKMNGNFAAMKEYNDLFKYMYHNWAFRAGIDNTEYETAAGKHPNVHIHIDLGQNRPDGQDMPFFFIEDNGLYQKRVLSEGDI